MTQTEKVLLEMLGENTGVHFLDSGGAYGRHWKRNQERDIVHEPPVVVDVEEGWLDIRFSTFHYCRAYLEYDEELTQDFDKWFEEAEANPYKIAHQEYWIKDRGWSIIEHGNSYEWENFLDQVIQFITFSLDPNDVDIYSNNVRLLLQVHGGCDVRGGYTKPRIFEPLDSEALSDFLYHMSYAIASCSNDPQQHYWITDNAGINWYQGHPNQENHMKYDAKRNKILCPCGGEITIIGMFENYLTKIEEDGSE